MNIVCFYRKMYSVKSNIFDTIFLVKKITNSPSNDPDMSMLLIVDISS